MNIVWTLVYIMIQGNDVYAVNAYGPGHTFPDMFECFKAREILSQDVGGQNGYFPNGMQAVCVPQEINET